MVSGEVVACVVRLFEFVDSVEFSLNRNGQTYSFMIASNMTHALKRFGESGMTT